MNATLPSTFGPAPTRRARRLTVTVFTGGLLLVTAASLLALGGLDAPRNLAVRATFLLGAVLTLAGAARLALPTMQGLQTRRAGQLDERQQWRVAQALAASYRTVSLLLFALVGVLTFATPAAVARLVRPGSLGSAGLLFTLVFLLASLPSAILAWTEPDDEREA